MKKSHPNPDFFNPRNPGRSLSFLEDYYTYYQKYVELYSWYDGYSSQPAKYGRTYIVSHYNGIKAYWPLIHKFYFEGQFLQQALNLPFDEFSEYIIQGIPNKLYEALSPPKKWGPSWRRRRAKDFVENPNHFREKVKYQKKKTHCKKERSEKYLLKQEWREKKGINRDNQKANYRITGIPKWLKRHCHKMHRQMQRECIYRENYCKLPTCKTDKTIFDPWMFW